MDRVCGLLLALVGMVILAAVSAESEKATETQKVTLLSETTDTDDVNKRSWNDMRAAWGKRGMDYDEESFENSARGEKWPGPGAWGKRAGEWNNLRAWGKRAGEWNNLRAWGKRVAPEWTYGDLRDFQQRMEATKQRMAGTSLASWGR